MISDTGAHHPSASDGMSYRIVSCRVVSCHATAANPCRVSTLAGLIRRLRMRSR
jgi:hypothetical protein